jgi:hypothetical protein
VQLPVRRAHRYFYARRCRYTRNGHQTVAYALGFLSLASAFCGVAHAQDAAQNAAANDARSPDTPPPTIQLAVAKDRHLQIALEKGVRLKETGQALHGRIVEPVHAFDKLVIPVGTEVTGQVTAIDPVSAGKRTAAALDANFSPSRKFQLTFNELVLADAKHIPFEASIMPGSGEVLDFVSSADEHARKLQRSKRRRRGKSQAG